MLRRLFSAITVAIWPANSSSVTDTLTSPSFGMPVLLSRRYT